jgi:DedD protein
MMRQRLVGTLVLLCAGVILWSLLFTSPAEYKLDRTSQIPPAPQIDPVLNRDPQMPEGIPDADEPIVEPQPQLPPSDEPEPAPVPVSVIPESVKTLEAPKPVAPAAPAPAPAKPKKVVPPPAPKASGTTLDQSGLPTSWVVQVGSFGQSANADSLRKKLQAKGHKAFVDQRSTSGRTLYRVLVGPILAKDLAEAESRKINSELGLKSIVTRYEAKP